MHLVIAASWLDPIVNLLSSIIAVINAGVHNPGLSLVILAALIRLIFWPLNTAQFKSMIGMQKIAPKIKKLQERYKSDPQKMQSETMALYKSEGVNPLSGCWPTLVQLPILFSVYYAVVFHKELFDTPFLWIGSALSANPPHIFGEPLLAASLAHPDVLLIVIYMVSQYIAMRFTTMPPTDPSQASQLKMMQVLSPVMIGFFGFRAQWPSAMVLYWLSYNLFTMGQQFYLLRRYHTPLSAIDSEHAIVENVPDEPPAPAKKKLPNANGAPKTYKVKKKTKGAQP
ncbi:MAG: membrane protein insertase YidC [bacterium]|nr:membrane protein insertase YidC [bacterium]